MTQVDIDATSVDTKWLYVKYEVKFQALQSLLTRITSQNG
uniref:Uncharacterized protein n=1 Tax=Arundo donax TaxID=35708 RepID=A0A0A9GDD9_ARUDO